MLNFALIGYGKMGQAVAQAAQAKGHHVVATIDPQAAAATARTLSAENLNGAEIAIEFTNPKAFLANITALAKLKISVVTGTTGWLTDLPQVQKIVAENKIGLLYASNFSQPVHIFTQAVKLVAQQLSKLSGFDVALHETHHTGKIDAPSGTALTLAETILQNFPTKKSLLKDNAEQPVPDTALQISATRLGKTVGIHSVYFDSESDTLELTHRGKNRQAYAAGSLAGAEWLQGRTGVFSLQDWLGLP